MKPIIKPLQNEKGKEFNFLFVSLELSLISAIPFLLKVEVLAIISVFQRVS